MNEMRRYRSESDEIAEISAIVARHEMPPFVTGFDVTLGFFDDEPAMWIAFHTVGDRPSDPEVRRQRIEAVSRLRDAVHHALRTDFPERYPYYRYANSVAGSIFNRP